MKRNNKKGRKTANEKNVGLRVMPFAGAETVGLNAYIVQYDDDIFIIDYGVTFSDWDTLGIEYILPPLKWLEKNKKKIKAIIVTHAHYDHIGGISFVLDRLGNPPIYGSNFAMEFLKGKLKESKKLQGARLNVVGENDIISFGKVKVGFVHVTHSIPQSYSVYLDTPEGRVFYSGDYKLDKTPIKEKPTDMAKIRRLGKEGVLVALLDSTNAFDPGVSKSESEVIETLKKDIRGTHGRVIIATFSSLVTRLSGLISAARSMNKKIFVSGRSLESNIKIAMKIGYIFAEKGVFVGKKEVAKIPDNQLIVLTTGSQGEQFASLTRMANGQHKDITLKKTDKVIFSSSVIPSRMVEVQKLMDSIAKKGVQIVNSKIINIHSSGHPNQGEMVEMAKAINAKYIVPVHGFTSFTAQHKIVLKNAGFDESKIFLPVEGSVFAFKNKNLTQQKKIDVKYTYAIGNVILENGEAIIRESRQLALEGICALSVTLKKNVVQDLSVIIKGVSYPEQQMEMVETIKKNLSSIMGTKVEEKKLKKMLYGKVGIYFHRRVRKTPIIAVDVVLT